VVGTVRKLDSARILKGSRGTRKPLLPTPEGIPGRRNRPPGTRAKATEAKTTLRCEALRPRVLFFSFSPFGLFGSLGLYIGSLHVRL
jgi:hypothetical protein